MNGHVIHQLLLQLLLRLSSDPEESVVWLGVFRWGQGAYPCRDLRRQPFAEPAYPRLLLPD